jgi:hypothetical protein
LVATDDPDLSVTSWTWNVSYKFDTVNGVSPNIPSHSIVVLAGSTIDLTTVIKVPSSTGVGTEQAVALVSSAQSAAVAAAQEAANSADSAQAAANYAQQAENAITAADSLIDGRIDAKLVRDLLADGTDLNLMNTTAHVGTYAVGVSPLNGPPVALPSTATLEIGRGSNFAVYQRITAGTTIWFREIISVSAGTWFGWTQIVTLDVNGKVPTAQLPAGTSSVAGTMSAADKSLLDGATSAATASTLVKRNSTGDINVNTPTSTGHPTTKAYVDAMVWDGSDITTGTISDARIANATSVLDGLMPKADKAKLDAATASATDGTLVMRYNGGETNFKGVYLSAAPTSISHATRKDYVDGAVSGQVRLSINKPATDAPSTYSQGVTYSQPTSDGTWPVTTANVMTIRYGPSRTFQMVVGKVTGTVWVRSEDTDTWGVFTQLATTAAATAAVAGLMSAIDKAKLDAATSSSTAVGNEGKLLIRDASGYFGVPTPTTASNPARKDYVDNMVWDGSDITTGTISEARIANSTSILDGLMSKADKAKLDATSSGSIANTLMYRDATNTSSAGIFLLTAAQSADARAATRKDYVDNMVWDGSDITTGTISDARIANATSVKDGLMPMADKAKLDGATAAATGLTLAMRYSDGRMDATTPTGTGNVANKAYVDGKVWDGADITTGTISDARIAKATSVLDGLMLKTDKAKLDAATGGATGSTLALRYSDGRLGVTTPTGSGDAANKSYVDNAVTALPLGLVGFTNAVSLTSSLSTTDTMMLEKTVSVVSGRNYNITWNLDFYGETAGSIALLVSVITGGTGATGTVIGTNTIWSSPTSGSTGITSYQLTVKYTATSTASLRFAYITNRAVGASNYRAQGRVLRIEDMGSAI